MGKKEIAKAVKKMDKPGQNGQMVMAFKKALAK